MRVLLIFSAGEAESIADAFADLEVVEVVTPHGADGSIRDVITEVRPDIVITNLMDEAALNEIARIFPRERVIIYTSRKVGYASRYAYEHVLVLHGSYVSKRALAFIVEELAARHALASVSDTVFAAMEWH